GGGLYHDMPYSFPRLYLALGVTTIRTTGSMEPYTDLEIKKAVDAGKIPGPKMNATGPYMEGEGIPLLQLHQLTGPECAIRTMEDLVAEGARSFKVYNYLTRAELKAVVETAHKHGIKVTGHLCSIGFREAADIGLEDVEHGVTVDTKFHPEKKPVVCPNQNRAAAAAPRREVTSEPI